MRQEKKVAYVYPYAFQYRVPFHEHLKRKLKEHNVSYDVIYSSEPHFPARGDFVAPSWAIDVRCDFLRLGNVDLRYQHALRRALNYNLVVVQQENGLLVNYPLQLLRGVGGPKVAFFGHGRNFQAQNPNGLAEYFKSIVSTNVDWWFAYTSVSAEHIAQSGFPSDRITVFNNAIDTSKIQDELASITQTEKLEIIDGLCKGSQNIAIYIGALYDLKRLPFLIEAAERVREQIPDFHLLIVGGGPEATSLQVRVAELDYVHVLGPRFGREKTLFASVAKVFLMPGLVGLAVLDSFAYGTPMVTTAVPYHSPEIAYLEHGRNGVIVDDWDNPEAYARAVAEALLRPGYLAELRDGGKRCLQAFTIEQMAERFAAGVLKALDE